MRTTQMRRAMEIKHGRLLAWMGLAILLGCSVSRRAGGVHQVVASQAGRDQALLRLIRGARNTVYLLTERLTLVPAGNELAQAVQRGVVVNLELPLEAAGPAGDARLARMLMDLGAVVAFKGDATGSIRGAYLETDGETFLYSAVPVAISLPGACVSFVSGPVPR
jgi:hypothetical protein